jgi:hypothetical protein
MQWGFAFTLTIQFLSIKRYTLANRIDRGQMKGGLFNASSTNHPRSCYSSVFDRKRYLGFVPIDRREVEVPSFHGISGSNAESYRDPLQKGTFHETADDFLSETGSLPVCL